MRVYVQIHGAARGPFSIEQVRTMLVAKKISPASLALIEGETEWRQLYLVPGLHDAQLLSKPDIYEPTRKVSLWLGIGIFFVPYVFSWFTLAKGYPRYSTTARVVAFSWMAFLLLGTIAGQIVKPPNAGSTASSSSSNVKEKSTGNMAIDLPKYQSQLLSIDPSGSLILSVSPGRSADEVEIKVSNQFHYQPYQVRYQAAQGLYNAWASIHSPSDPDSSRIHIVDMMGNEVGGSRALAGSLIWVQD